VQDTLGLGAGKVDTAYSAMTKAIEVVNEIKDKLVAATGASSTDKAKLQSEISALQSQLKMGADGATFSGSNWLTLDTTTAVVPGVADDSKIVAAYTRSAAGTPVLQTIDVDVDSVKLYEAFATATQDQKGILDGRRSGTTGLRDETSTVAVAGTFLATDGFAVATLTVVGFNDQQIGQMLAVIDTAAKEMTDAATTLGTAKKRIDIQRSATQSLMDADMNLESTRLQALQVQQQLGIQALSIANSNAQSILSLFRG
jgi:flagellin